MRAAPSPRDASVRRAAPATPRARPRRPPARGRRRRPAPAAASTTAAAPRGSPAPSRTGRARRARGRSPPPRAAAARGRPPGGLPAPAVASFHGDRRPRGRSRSRLRDGGSWTTLLAGGGTTRESGGVPSQATVRRARASSVNLDQGLRAGSAPTPGESPSRRDTGGAVVMSNTATSTTAAAASVRGDSASPPKQKPRNMATTGFTNAYVATTDGGWFRSRNR